MRVGVAFAQLMLVLVHAASNGPGSTGAATIDSTPHDRGGADRRRATERGPIADHRAFFMVLF